MRPLSGKGRLAAALLLLLLLGGCGGGYYLQAVGGHLEVMRASQPAARLLADPGTPAPLRARLELAADALDFAHSELGLPDNGSYRSYADLGRPHVVWNVVAAPEFSLEPVQWCFPVAGCLPYRGYFREERAREFAAGLAADGHDVHVGGVSAYSTLGRFADPLLNTMLSWPPADFVALLFHELAHQHIYVRNDAAFNEGFATFVEREGLRRYLLREGREAEFCAREQALARREIVLELLIALRTELQFLYGQSLPEEETRWRKAALIETTRAEYARIAAGWDSGPRYAHLLPPGLNNAMLLAIATYEDQVPTFAALLQEQDGDLQAFYARVRELAESLPAQRAVAMNELARRARPESLARLYPCENGEAS